MLSLFDMLNKAGQGRGVEQLGTQFGLSQKQTEDALEALLPAFSQGLKRNASDAHGAGNFLGAIASGRHADYFDDAGKALSQQGMDEGKGILGHLFGSKDVSRAVASHAAQASGVGESTLKEMLPALASMIMGGISKQSTGQAQAARASSGGSGNILGDLMEQMMRQMGEQAGRSGGSQGGQYSQPTRRTNPSSPPGDNPLGRVLEEMFGGGASRQAPQQQQQPSQTDNPLGRVLEGMFGGGKAGNAPTSRQQQPQQRQADNPLGQIFEEFLGGARGQQQQRQPQPDPRVSQRTDPNAAPRSPYDDLFGKMFDTGRKTNNDYESGVENIFEQFRQGMERRR